MRRYRAGHDLTQHAAELVAHFVGRLETPIDLLVRYACVPVRREGERIVLAFAGLEDPQRIDELEYLLERPIEAAVAPAEPTK